MDARCTPEEFTKNLLRTADRLRSCDAARMNRENRIGATLEVLNALAHGQEVPELSVGALGDQLTVLGKEFLKTANEKARVELSAQISRLRAML